MTFAIHLGALNTTIYKKGSGIVLTEPTCIAYSKSPKGAIKVTAVGTAAQKMQDKTGSDVFVATPIEFGRIVRVELVQIFLAELLKRLGDKRTDSFLFLIPCSLTTEELTAYKTVAYSCGIHNAKFIPLVIANAIELGFGPEDSTAGLSIHISEDGTEIGVISFLNIVSGGSVDAGGATLTRAIREGVKKQFSLDISAKTALLARQETATLVPNDESQFRINGMDIFSHIIRDMVFTGKHCYEYTVPIYTEIVNAVKQVLMSCTPAIITDIVRGNIFIGGEASWITGFREFFSKELEIAIKQNTQITDNSAILGAGKLLNHPSLVDKIIKAN